MLSISPFLLACVSSVCVCRAGCPYLYFEDFRGVQGTNTCSAAMPCIKAPRWVMPNPISCPMAEFMAPKKSAHENAPKSYHLRCRRCPMPDAQCPMPSAQCPMPNDQCPVPSAQCPMPNAQCPMPLLQCPMPNECPMPDAQCPMPDSRMNVQCPMPNTQCAQKRMRSLKGG